MRLNSIRVKLFAIIAGAFLCSTITILLIADKKLTEIIDTSKNAFYSEKIDAIWSILHQYHVRLMKTGLVEAYLEEFKANTLKELKQTNYNQQGLSIYPFIIDLDGNIVMHPTLPEKSALPADRDIVNRFLAAERGEFNFTFMGQEKYYIFRSFPEWGWIIGYAVPLEIKYQEARTFRTLLLLIMSGVTLVVLFLLIPAISRIAKPITLLTKAARDIAEGDLDKEINIRTNDEVGALAESFEEMRIAIKQTIYELELENAERKHAEEALAHEKEQLAVTLISIGDGVITTDRSGHILLMNKVAEELTGWHNQEAIGRDLEEVFTAVDQRNGEPAKPDINRREHIGPLVVGERQQTLMPRSGETVIVASNCAPIKDAQHNIIGAILVFRDITKQLQIEQELFKFRKLESVGVLAGGIAHDFNNILAVILGNVTLTLMDLSLSEKIRQRLTNVEKASLRAQGLTQQLLTFSKGGDPIRVVSSLENLVRDATGLALHGRNVSCRCNIPDDLWLAEIDRGQISQVIQNMVINGCEAMPGGGTITLSCSNVVGDDSTSDFIAKGKKHVAISIADSGEGIPPENHDKIFDPYFTTKTNRNGLGLAVCHSIVAKHNGYIGVDSSRSSGTVFTIYLPASEELPVAAMHNRESVPETMKATVMIMDDEELIRELVEMMLEEMGHTPVLAADGTEAVALYKKNKAAGTPIDLVIMDLTIPGAMGGKEAIQELLAFDPKAKAIVCSGYSNDPIMADPGKYGFLAAVAKPYKYDVLAEVIAKTAQDNQKN